MQADIAIAVVAYNRPHALERLLISLNKAIYNGYKNISLIISIDYSGEDDCYAIANNFAWQYGKKSIKNHKEKQGLKNHVLACGDLSLQHDGIIVLEDDLFAAPGYYEYAQQAFAFYGSDNQVAGIGLYNYKYNEFAHCPFDPITDGFDNYFMQIPCSWGQLWTKNQWLSFKEYVAKEHMQKESSAIPAAVLNWPVKSSWKRSFYKYIVDTNKYFVYPRIGLTTNFGEIGEHFNEIMYVWQTPLLVGNKQFQFSSLSVSISIYDSFFELDAIAFERITGDNISVSFDLNGTKSLINIETDYLFSCKFCKNPIKQYLPQLYPYECNIIFGRAGSKRDSLNFYFGKISSFSDESPYNRLGQDVKRTLPHLDHMLTTSKVEVYNSLPYKIGNNLLKISALPDRIFRKLKGK